MAASLQPLDLAFLWVLRATAGLSAVVLLVLAARAVLRGRLGPGARYGLWLLMALPLVAAALPPGLVRIPLPQPSSPPRDPAPADAPGRALPTAVAQGWRLVYGPPAGRSAVRPDVAATESRSRPTPLRAAAALWLAGAAALALRVAVSHALAVWRLRGSVPVTDPAVAAVLEECRRAVGVRRLPLLVSTPPDTGPALLGVLRPRLLLPRGLSDRLTRAELRFVFLHELVHLKRHDVAAEWLLALLQVAHWFNPLVWLAAGRCRADREVACDATVLALAGGPARADYGRTILKLSAALVPGPRLASAVGILETQSPLERRLRMIALAPDRRPARWAAALVVALAAGVAALASAGPATSKEPAANAGPAPEARDVPYAEVLNDPPDWPDLTTVADERPEGAADAAAGDADAKNAQVRAQLDRRLPAVDFDGVPLSKAIDTLRDVSGANIFVNWRALENAGVDRTAPVTARLRNIRFSKALTIILDSASGGTVPVGYTVDDGVITLSTADDLDRNTVTRVYDVRDLVTPVPDFDMVARPAARPAARGDGAARREDAGGAAAPDDADDADEPATRRRNVEDLINLLKETVEPRRWGKAAALRELQGQLIVTATPEMHRSIVELLAQLRETRGVQIVVEARLVAAGDDVLDALPAELRKAVAGALQAGKDPAPAGRAAGEGGAGGAGKSVVLDTPEVDEVLRAVQASGTSTVVSVPRVTLFNGQGVYVSTETRRPYVADYAVVKQADGKTRYEPQIATAEAGVLLRARATVSADRKYATLTLHPRLSYLAGMEEVAWDKSPPGEKLTVRRPRMLVSQLGATISVPDGGTLLLGGLRGYVTAEGGEAKPGEKPVNVLMLVKPTVIIQREIEAAQFPLRPPRRQE